MLRAVQPFVRLCLWRICIVPIKDQTFCTTVYSTGILTTTNSSRIHVTMVARVATSRVKDHYVFALFLDTGFQETFPKRFHAVALCQ